MDNLNQRVINLTKVCESLDDEFAEMLKESKPINSVVTENETY